MTLYLILDWAIICCAAIFGTTALALALQSKIALAIGMLIIVIIMILFPFGVYNIYKLGY